MPDQLISCKNLLIPMRPTKSDKIVNKGLRQVPHRLIRQDRCCPMSLTQACLIRTKYHRQMSEYRNVPSKCLIYMQLFRRIVDMIVASDHMAYRHINVINYNDEIVGWSPIGTHYYHIF